MSPLFNETKPYPKLINEHLYKQKYSIVLLKSSHRLLRHEFLHQRFKTPIRVHQLCLWTNKVIRKLPHTTKEGVFKHPRSLVHPICHLSSELENLVLVPRNRSNLRDNHWVLRILGMSSSR